MVWRPAPWEVRRGRRPCSHARGSWEARQSLWAWGLSNDRCCALGWFVIMKYLIHTKHIIRGHLCNKIVNRIPGLRLSIPELTTIWSLCLLCPRFVSGAALAAPGLRVLYVAQRAMLFGCSVKMLSCSVTCSFTLSVLGFVLVVAFVEGCGSFLVSGVQCSGVCW